MAFLRRPTFSYVASFKSSPVIHIIFVVSLIRVPLVLVLLYNFLRALCFLFIVMSNTFIHFKNKTVPKPTLSQFVACFSLLHTTYKYSYLSSFNVKLNK